MKLLPFIAVLGAAFILVFAGCGGDDSATTSATSAENGGEETTVNAADETPANEAEERVEALFEGTYEAPSADSPPPAADKNVWLISCGQSLASCKDAIDGSKEAAESLGWNANVFDTKGDPTAAGTGVRQAIAAKADGIFVYFIDCSYMQKPLQEAADAGIAVVAAESFDCSQQDESAPSLFTHVVSYVEGEFPQWVEKFAEAQGIYVAAKTEPGSSSIFFSDSTSQAAVTAEGGFTNGLATCADCENEIVQFSYNELVAGIQQPVEQEFLRNPDLAAVGVAYDGILLSGVSSALSRSNNPELVVVAAEGSQPVMDLARDGVVDAGVGLPNEWEGYAGIDALNRLFNDSDPVSSGIGIQIWDQDHNLPESGGFQPPVDFKKEYQTSWGVG